MARMTFGKPWSKGRNVYRYMYYRQGRKLTKTLMWATKWDQV